MDFPLFFRSGGTVTSLMDIQNVNLSVERVSEKCQVNSSLVGGGGQSQNSKSTNQTIFLQHTTHQQHHHQFSTTNTKAPPLVPIQTGYSAQNNNTTTETSQPLNNNTSFFQQETLDMSQEDIQRTLSANMGQIVDTAVDMSYTHQPMSPSAEEVFGNLDAFDILGDLADDLDNLPQNGEKNTIVDINPEWAYSEVWISFFYVLINSWTSRMSVMNKLLEPRVLCLEDFNYYNIIVTSFPF